MSARPLLPFLPPLYTPAGDRADGLCSPHLLSSISLPREGSPLSGNPQWSLEKEKEEEEEERKGRKEEVCFALPHFCRHASLPGCTHCTPGASPQGWGKETAFLPALPISLPPSSTAGSVSSSPFPTSHLFLRRRRGKGFDTLALPPIALWGMKYTWISLPISYLST